MYIRYETKWTTKHKEKVLNILHLCMYIITNSQKIGSDFQKLDDIRYETEEIICFFFGLFELTNLLRIDVNGSIKSI